LMPRREAGFLFGLFVPPFIAPSEPIYKSTNMMLWYQTVLPEMRVSGMNVRAPG